MSTLENSSSTKGVSKKKKKEDVKILNKVLTSLWIVLKVYFFFNFGLVLGGLSGLFSTLKKINEFNFKYYAQVFRKAANHLNRVDKSFFLKIAYLFEIYDRALKVSEQNIDEGKKILKRMNDEIKKDPDLRSYSMPELDPTNFEHFLLKFKKLKNTKSLPLPSTNVKSLKINITETKEEKKSFYSLITKILFVLALASPFLYFYRKKFPLLQTNKFFKALRYLNQHRKKLSFLFGGVASYSLVTSSTNKALLITSNPSLPFRSLLLRAQIILLGIVVNFKK